MAHTKIIERALEADRTDPLAAFREQFLIPRNQEGDKTYLLGNSLGLQPKQVRQVLDDVLTQWQQFGVEGFFEGEDPWMKKQEKLAKAMAPIVGAKPEELSIQDSLTINLHLLFTSFYQPRGRKTKILCEAKAFPSDQYMLQSQVSLKGLLPDAKIIELSPREGEDALRSEDILSAIEQYQDELALVFFGGVHYYSGQQLDMAAITMAAHGAGVLVGFDLAHAAGNIDLSLHDWGIDFAAWCNYKYLNGGPGAIGSIFVHEIHHTSSLPRMAGWWGNDPSNRFMMEKSFRPAHGAAGWQVSTPPALLMASLDASLKIFNKAGWTLIAAKRDGLRSLLHDALDELSITYPRSFRCLTPRTATGCQCSLFFPKQGKEIFAALTENGIMADWREPGVIRVAPVPLYNRYVDIARLYEVLAHALASLNT